MATVNRISKSGTTVAFRVSEIPESGLPSSPSQKSASGSAIQVRERSRSVSRMKKLRRRISASFGKLSSSKDEPIKGDTDESDDTRSRDKDDCVFKSEHSNGLSDIPHSNSLSEGLNRGQDDTVTQPSNKKHTPVKRHLSTGDMLIAAEIEFGCGTGIVTKCEKPKRPKSEGCLDKSSPKRVLSFGGDSPFGKLAAYQKLEQLGEGSYATVYKGKSNLNNKIVALKEIRLQEEEGTPFTAIREASLLKGLKHANIVILHDIIHTKETLTFVFEYVYADLSQYLEANSGGLNLYNVKLFLFQLLRGISYCHQRRILHRDLKPQNLLISKIGELKLADFGLARAKSVPSRTYSNEVVTLWYRPPDALLGSTEYSTSLDIWGVGCIYTEMITGMATFPGMKDSYDQLDRIWRLLGTPTEETWEGVSRFPNYSLEKFGRYRPRRFSDVMPRLSDAPYAEALAKEFLQLIPSRRISARDALNHHYFHDLPSQIYRIPDVASIFIVPGLNLQSDKHLISSLTKSTQKLAV